MFGALERGFRSIASLILVRNVVGELRPKGTLAASRGFLAAVRRSCSCIIIAKYLYSQVIPLCAKRRPQNNDSIILFQPFLTDSTA